MTNDAANVPSGSSQSESGGSDSSNITSLEPGGSVSSPGPASEGSSALNNATADGPTYTVSSTDQSLQISNESSSVVGGGSANQSSSETIGSSNTPASHPTGDNSTTASVSLPSNLAVVAEETISASSS